MSREEGFDPSSTKTSTFSFAGLELRCVTIEGAPWFVATDVCAMIGLTHVSNALRGIPADERSTCNRITVGMAPGAPINLISESGLYALVMRSDKPKAREFQTWVTGTVLPAIRKDGMYLRGEEKLDLSKDADLAMMTMAVMEALKKKIEDAEARAK